MCRWQRKRPLVFRFQDDWPDGAQEPRGQIVFRRFHHRVFALVRREIRLPLASPRRHNGALDARAAFFQFSSPVETGVVAGRKANARAGGRSCSAGRQIRLPGAKHSRTKEYEKHNENRIKPARVICVFFTRVRTHTYGYVRVRRWTRTKSPSTTGINRLGKWLFFAVFSIFVFIYFFNSENSFRR